MNSKNTLRRSALWLIVLLSGLWSMSRLTACHTVEGMGADVEDTGGAIQGASEGARNH